MSEHKHFFKKTSKPERTRGAVRVRVRKCRCGKYRINMRKRKKEDY